MNTGHSLSDALDLSLLAKSLRRLVLAIGASLLAVQRAVARKHGEYTYLEIGSHLGGSLQPHLATIDAKGSYSQTRDRATA